jgi:hypothetical protein
MREKYYQGRFTPKNYEKYIGDYKNIIYRSSWELRFMKYCDENSNVIEWGSEEFFIQYFDPTTDKVRKYFPDFIIKVKELSGKIKKYIIEVKPEKQTQPPTQSKNKRKKTYITESLTYEKNIAKWKAATEFCEDNGLIFKIITEKELGIK